MGKKQEARLGPLLRSHRIRAGLKQSEYAKRLQISKAQMSKLEAGLHTPIEGTVLKMLQILLPDLGRAILEVEAQLESKTHGRYE